jgi:hypothetical protein
VKLPSPGGSAPTVSIMTPPPVISTLPAGSMVVDLAGSPTIIYSVTFDATTDELLYDTTGGVTHSISAAGYTFDEGTQSITETADNTSNTAAKNGNLIYQHVTDVVARVATPAPAATLVPPTPPPAPVPVVTTAPPPPPAPTPAPPPVYTTAITVPVVTPVVVPATPAVPASIIAPASPTIAFWLWLLILLVILYLSYKDGYRPNLT